MTIADMLLTAYLVLVLPAYMLARSLESREGPSGDRATRYRRSIVLIALPVLALVTLWTVTNRPPVALGLGAPDRVGAVLIAVAALSIAILAVLAPRAKRPTDPARHVAAAAMLPVSPRETAWFLLFVLAAGIGWEILYRGFLFWALSPAFGVVGAVATMALSYGVAHGYRGVGPFVGSIVSALLFATGYALTGSVWWLAVIHVGLPLVGLRARPTVA